MMRRNGWLALLLLLGTSALTACPSEPDPEGGEGQACRADGSCDGSLVCLGGTCQVGPGSPCDGVDCSGHGSCRDDAGSAVCDCTTGYAGGSCDGCDLAGGFEEDPPGSGLCVSTTCAAPECSDGAQRCEDAGNLSTCTGECWGPPAACGATQVCVIDACLDVVCTAGEVTGCESATELARCNATSTGTTPEACPGTQACDTGVCLDVICTPGEGGCADASTPELCNTTGTGWDLQVACGTGSSCGAGGSCQSPCDLAVADPSHLGCSFVAVDLDQILDAGGGAPSPAAGTFSIIVTNPHASLPATVAVQSASGSNVSVGDGIILPGEHRGFTLPRLDVDGTGLGLLSYRVTTDLPVSVVQVNPDIAVPVSTEGSLLLPTAHLGTEYRVLAWPSHLFLPPSLPPQRFSSYVAIVATEAGPTQVTVTPSVDLDAGGGIAAVAANVATTFDLQPGQVLSLETTMVDGADLSGSLIQSTQNVAVFTGHEGAMVPPTSGFLDHLEEQLLPTSRWALRHVAVKSPPRGTEVDVWRILAREANTTVTTNPPQAGTPAILGAGEWLEIATAESFEIVADQPLLVAQYLVGSGASGVPGDPACAGGATGLGDPAMALLPGVEHWRSEYTLPGLSTLNSNTLTVITTAGNQVSLGGPPLPPGSWLPVGAGTYVMAYVVLTPGTRSVTAPSPFGVLMHGFACDAARAWPGGFDLTER